MNKKFSTLMAVALLTGTVVANAESVNPSRAYQFRGGEIST